MSTKTQKTVIGVDDELGRYLFNAAAEMVRCKDLKDAMDGELSSWRSMLITSIPDIKEYLPPDAKSIFVEGHDDTRNEAGATRYRLTIQRTGGQERINKVKLLELGVSSDIIQQATEKSQEGETVVAARA